MEENNHSIAEGWKTTSFGEKDLFKIIGSGIKHFEGEKDYYSTSSIDANKVLFPEQVITYRNRPSRANMQPIQNSVWFAKMKNTFKILKAQRRDIEEVILSTGFSGIESKTVDCDYLMQILSSSEFNSQKNLLAEGSTQEAVNNAKIKEIKFLIPESNSEQSTIASILSKADEAISQTEQLIAKYSRIKTGLMQDLLTKGIDEHGNIRSEETHEFEDSPLGRIPKDWSIKRLDQITKPNSPIVYGILMPGKHFFGGIPVIKVKDIYDEKVHFEELLFTSPAIANSFKRSELMTDDLLFTIRGTVGRCAFVPQELHGANITQDTARIRIKDEYREYVRFTFETPDSRLYIQLNTIGQAVKGINLKALRELTILIPPPNEAQLIAKELNNANELLSVETVKLNKLQSLKTGLMQDLLSGKVRVNHMIEGVQPKEKIV